MRGTDVLLAGHARADISPGRDCALIGYDQRAEFFPGGGNAGVHDPLFADALVLEFGGTRAALCTLDLCVLETPLANDLRNAVAAAAGCPAGAVFLACSHTHSGPYPHRGGDHAAAEALPGILLGAASRAYAGFLEEALVRAAREAAGNQFPSSARHRSSTLGMGYTRRVRLADDTISMAWNLREWDGPDPVPAADQAFEVLVIERSGAPSIVVWNAAAHPVVLGKRSNIVSADWPGAARAAIESALPEFRAMFLHGAGADVHPWLATGEDPLDPARVAAPAASLCALLVRTPGGGLASEDLRIAADGELSALGIGPVRLLACAFEMFGSTGRDLRSAFPRLLIASTSNGWSGYCAPSRVFEEGGYEAEASLAAGWKPGDCEVLTGRAKNLLSSL